MKKNLAGSILVLAVLSSTVGGLVARHAFSDEYGSNDRYNERSEDRWEGARRHNHRAFDLGVCVGQALAQQNIILPPPQPGVPPSPNPTNQAAFKSAVQQCRSEFSGTPVPSATPSAAPTSTPAPTDTGTPAPTDTTSP